jgi:hypothetical protein
MNAPRARFDLVAAQSPLVDRRSLSQAWYSALRLASRKKLAGGSPPVRPAPHCHPERRRAERAVVEGRRSCDKIAVVPRLRASTTPYARDDKVGEPSLSKRTLATITSAKARRSSVVRRFVIESARGRVIVHVLRRDDRVHLVALCGAAVRGDVEKALAQARFALAGMGMRVR